MSYPTTPATFPPRVPLAVVRAADLNGYADELEAVEGGWLSTYSETAAVFRLRQGVGLEFGDGVAAGGMSTLAHQSVEGSPYIGFHCEPGTNPNTLKTRGIPGVILCGEQNGAGFTPFAAPAANADNQALQAMLHMRPEGLVTYQLAPMVRLRHSALQSIPNNTVTAAIFDTEDADPNGMHTPGGSTVTIAVNGWYVMTAHVLFGTSATGSRFANIAINGVLQPGAQVRQETSNPSITLTWLAELAAADVVDLRVRQTSGAAMNISSTTLEFHNRLALARIF